MSTTRISARLRRNVRERASERCEYCLLADADGYFSHEPDHVIAEKHGGETVFDNLAWACFDCNRFKGSDIASLDPISGKLVSLFNPRSQRWSDHFQLAGVVIVALTGTGRATERLLKLNLPARIEVRETLTRAGRYPPES
jgi:hypothetical protein